MNYNILTDNSIDGELSQFFLKHYGTPRHSGRYPWGSGEHPYQAYGGFLGTYHDLQKEGMRAVDIAKALDCYDTNGKPNTSVLRARVSYAKNEMHKMDFATAIKMKNKGMSITAIAERMGKNESSIRSLLDNTKKNNQDELGSTMDALKLQIKDKELVDIGKSSEKALNVTRTTMDRAVINLQDQGYGVLFPRIKQAGTNNSTPFRILVSPERYGTTEEEHKAALKYVYQNTDKIHAVTDVKIKEDATGQKHAVRLHEPVSIPSSRVHIRYAEDGGKEKDGNIEINPNAKDLSLGKSRYAQVRILVDDGYYVKGVATYGDPKDFPKGTDIIFNTNKDKTHPKTGDDSVLKKVKKDEVDPILNTVDPLAKFGATIVDQNDYYDDEGKLHKGALNIVNKEGDWGEWSRNLPSQFLSKQPKALAKKQLALAYDSKQAEYDEISQCTNPVIKESLLNQFAESCDSAAVHMKAAAMPRQQTHVLIPIPEVKPTEVYAPNYKDGETVCLVRFPHAGRFEIPELTVNNRNKKAKSVLGKAKDAVGVNALTAEQLSGADFDGDTVLVIPNDGSILAEKAIKGLATFDTQGEYPGGRKNGLKIVGRFTKKTAEPGTSKTDYDGFNKGIQMGLASNLITDMTIAGATTDEIVRATKYSMVVIDAEKHQLNWSKAYSDFGIAKLQEKYQGKVNGGARTIISKAKGEADIPRRVAGEYRIDPETGKKKKYYIDPDTGEKLWTYTGETYIDKTGKQKLKMMKSTKMAEAKNAYELNPNPTPIESIYADHANKLKSLANKARKDTLTVDKYYRDKDAAKKYAEEVSSLKYKLNEAEKNAPLERQAQALHNAYLKQWKNLNPDADYDEVKKYSGRYIRLARERVGSGKKKINITDKEWEAIQNKAVSRDVLERIVANADKDRIKDLAMPKERTTMPEAKIARAKALLSAGNTQAEVAEVLGVSASTINKYVNK